MVHLLLCWNTDKLSQLKSIYVISYKFINSLWSNDTICHQTSRSTLVQVMACCLLGNKPSSELMLTCWQMDLCEQTSSTFFIKIKLFPLKIIHWQITDLNMLRPSKKKKINGMIKTLFLCSKNSYVYQIHCMIILPVGDGHLWHVFTGWLNNHAIHHVTCTNNTL